MQDLKFMKLALEASKKNIGITYPNPSVGCVIVKDNKIIAISTTAKGGRPHAETTALDIAGKNAIDATMYITLEPCCHYGVTPPCVNAIIEAKVKKVVIAITDIDRRVAGRGVDLLIESGVIVEVGLCKDEALEINKAYFKAKFFGIPYVTLKMATSLDGKIALANGKSKWITNELSRKFVHNIRAKNDGILVGIGTIKADNPSLDCRIENLEDYSPDIFIVDKNLAIDESSKVLKTKKTCYIIADIRNQHQPRAIKLENLGAKLIFLDIVDSCFNIDDVLKSINDIGITSLLIEGGSDIFTWFIKEKKWDELIWISANIILGNDSKSAIGNLKISELHEYKLKLKDSFSLDDDLIRIYEKS